MGRIFALCACVFLICEARAADAVHDVMGADNVRYVIRRISDGVEIRVLGAGVDGPDQAMFVALKTKESTGSFFIPPEPGKTGSAVWLPFAADTLVVAGSGKGNGAVFVRRWKDTQWGASESADDLVSVRNAPAQRLVQINEQLLGRSSKISMAVYLKDLGASQGRGRFYGAEDRTSASGPGERVIRHYLVMEFDKGGVTFRRAGRLDSDAMKTRFYRVNTKPGDISDAMLDAWKAVGFTHLYLADAAHGGGVLAEGAEEFKALARRIHDRGMKVMVGLVPHQWREMDAAIESWQALGADGFWAHQAQEVPPEFWRRVIARAHARSVGAYFVAAVDGGVPAEVTSGGGAVREAFGGDVRLELLDAGFDAVVNNPAHSVATAPDDNNGANALDGLLQREFLRDNSLHYVENSAGLAPSALLLGLSRGPVMVLEDAASAGGAPRDYFSRLLAALDQPAFRAGNFYPLNSDNRENPHYGRVDNGESGRWLYSYLRYDSVTGRRVLVVVNLHPKETLRDVRIQFARSAMRFLGWDDIAGSKLVSIAARDMLGTASADSAEIAVTTAEMEEPGFPLKELPPLSAAYFELTSPGRQP